MADSHGLGLSICKSIAKSLGGNLSYIDDKQGSHFMLQVKV
jgi:C4-dicarboxylate-specific signal transduction histidine kinase